MAAANAASEVFAEAKEQVSDLVAEAKAEQVWTALKNDRPVPKAATEGNASGEAAGVVTSS